MRRFVQGSSILLCVFLLASCSSNSTYFADYRPLAVGSVVQLMQPVVIAPRKARAYFQGGMRVKYSSMDQYYPSCSLEIRSLKEQPQTIHPERFRVSRIEWNATEVVQLAPVQLASLASLREWMHGMQQVTRYYNFWLVSEQQPDVLRLTCYRGFDEQFRARLPSLLEMQQSLGEIIRLEP